MDTSIFERVFEIIWSIAAICGGLALLFFRDRFISSGLRVHSYWYRKTGLPLFYQPDELARPVAVAIGVGFIVIGVLKLLEIMGWSLS